MSLAIGLALIITLAMLLGGAWLSVELARIDLGIFPILAAVFPFMTSWQYFLVRKARYYVTDQRVISVRKRVHDLSLDNIDPVSLERGGRLFGSKVYFEAADESDLDSVLSDLNMYSTLTFAYLRDSEAQMVKELVQQRMIPVKEPRVYRCRGCGFQTSSKMELIQHIRAQHHGSVS